MARTLCCCTRPTIQQPTADRQPSLASGSTPSPSPCAQKLSFHHASYIEVGGAMCVPFSFCLFSIVVLQPADPSAACKAPAIVPSFWLDPAIVPLRPAAIWPAAHSLRLLAAPRLSTHVTRRLIIAYSMVLELPRTQGWSLRVLLKHLLCYYPRVGCSLQVVAAGFTIAPLQPRFTGGGASGECLVTLVLKLDDLGGWLSGAHLGGLLLPWMRSILAEAAAGAVIALRDKA